MSKFKLDHFVNIYRIENLRSLLDKIINEYSDPYFRQQGHSLYRAGLISLRTNFYEPFLNEHFDQSAYSAYVKHFNKNIRKSERHKPLKKEKVNLWEKLVTVKNKGTRPADSILDIEKGIYAVHNKHLNVAIHKVINVNQITYASCYWHVQEFVREILGPSTNHLYFDRIADVILYINQGIQKYSRNENQERVTINNEIEDEILSDPNDEISKSDLHKSTKNVKDDNRKGFVNKNESDPVNETFKEQPQPFPSRHKTDVQEGKSSVRMNQSSDSLKNDKSEPEYKSKKEKSFGSESKNQSDNFPKPNPNLPFNRYKSLAFLIIAILIGWFVYVVKHKENTNQTIDTLGLEGEITQIEDSTLTNVKTDIKTESSSDNQNRQPKIPLLSEVSNASLVGLWQANELEAVYYRFYDRGYGIFDGGKDKKSVGFIYEILNDKSPKLKFVFDNNYDNGTKEIWNIKSVEKNVILLSSLKTNSIVTLDRIPNDKPTLNLRSIKNLRKKIFRVVPHDSEEALTEQINGVSKMKRLSYLLEGYLDLTLNELTLKNLGFHKYDLTKPGLFTYMPSGEVVTQADIFMRLDIGRVKDNFGIKTNQGYIELISPKKYLIELNKLDGSKNNSRIIPESSYEKVIVNEPRLGNGSTTAFRLEERLESTKYIVKIINPKTGQFVQHNVEIVALKTIKIIIDKDSKVHISSI